MTTSTYLLVFGLSNLLLFGVLAFFLIATHRQQRRLQELGKHLEGLLTELHHDLPHHRAETAAGGPMVEPEGGSGMEQEGRGK